MDAPRGAIGLLINNKSQVAGAEVGSPSGIPEKLDGILWDGPDLVELAPGGVFAVTVTGITDRGEWSATYAQCGQCSSRAFVARDGVLTTLPALAAPGRFSRAMAINRRGQIVGESLTAAFQVRATLWDDGVAIDLGSVGGDSTALDINRRGQIVGFSQDDKGIQHAVLWTVRP